MAGHRETLLHSTQSAFELFLNALPGRLVNDVDCAEQRYD
jgi:hypothetical protein